MNRLEGIVLPIFSVEEENVVATSNRKKVAGRVEGV
jgi:hypothetical protein